MKRTLVFALVLGIAGCQWFEQKEKPPIPTLGDLVAAYTAVNVDLNDCIKEHPDDNLQTCTVEGDRWRFIQGLIDARIGFHQQ
jgi:hypothetical protein